MNYNNNYNVNNNVFSTSNNIEGYSNSNTEFFQSYNVPINTDYGTNGRVVFDIKSSVPNYTKYSGERQGSFNVVESLQGIHEQTPLNNAFFSQENTDRIQQEIRGLVYKITESDPDPILEGHRPVVISRQNDTQLQLVMRSIYLQYAKHTNEDILSQVKQLNDLVIKETVPGIITNVKSYIGYSKDIQKLPSPLDHPINPSMKGEKTYSLLNI